MSIANSTASPSTTPASSARKAGIDLDWLSEKIDYRLYQDCVHCGLCTASCPRMSRPPTRTTARGRIYLMRAVTDGAWSGSRASSPPRPLPRLPRCEACPSGVQYGKIIEPFKVALQRRRPPAR